MPMSVLNITTDGTTRTIELYRPDKRNALNDELIAELKSALRKVHDEAGLRAVVIRGAGKDFCSGADLAAIQKIAGATYEENLEDAASLGELFTLMRQVRVPIIASVQGRALAGGCGLAFGCDLVIAAESARFGFPEVKIGFVPAMVAAIVRRNLGEKKTFELLTRGNEFGAAEAIRLGLINAVVPDDQLMVRTSEFAAVYGNISGVAVSLTKSLLNSLDGLDFGAAVSKGAEVNATARMSEDCKMGIARFLEK